MNPAAITTDRLTLRAPEMADAAAVAAVLQNVDVARWLTNPPFPYALADAQAFIAMDHEGAVYFIHDNDGLCGCITLRSDLGYWLAQDRWGRGYMTEAANAVVAAHFAASNAPLSSGHLVGNARSRRILVRLGFRDDRVISHFIPARKTETDVQKMRLTHADWEARA